MSTYERGLVRALEAAQQAPGPFRVGAALLKKGRALLWGWNYPGEVVDRRFHDPNGREASVHAEVDVILKGLRARSSLRDYTLYVARALRIAPYVGLAFPCPGCQSIIRRVGIPKVVYTVHDRCAVVWDVRKGIATSLPVRLGVPEGAA